MSITEKLAQALRILAEIPVEDFNKQNAPDYPLIAWNGCMINVQHVLSARTALAEYDAAPAVEVTADAVEVACKAAYDFCDMGPFPDMAVNPKHEREYMQAALAAAFPVLVQQVEGMKKRENETDFYCDNLTAEVERLSAANARLAKDAERLDFIESSECNEVAYSYDDDDEDFGWRVWNVAGSVNDREWTELGRGKTLRDAVDAATAQAKQAEGG